MDQTQTQNQNLSPSSPDAAGAAALVSGVTILCDELAKLGLKMPRATVKALVDSDLVPSLMFGGRRRMFNVKAVYEALLELAGKGCNVAGKRTANKDATA